MSLSKSECNLAKGCMFEVEAKEDLKSYIYIGDKDLANSDE